MQYTVNQCLMCLSAFCGFFCVFVKSVLSVVSDMQELQYPWNTIWHIGVGPYSTFIIFDIFPNPFSLKG